MTDLSVFEWTADALAGRTSLSTNEARGTLRLALKDAGLDPKTITRGQMEIVLLKLLPRALVKVRVESGAEICKGIVEAMASAELASPLLHSAADVFGRIGRR